MQNILVETKDIRLIPFLMSMMKETKGVKIDWKELELFLNVNLPSPLIKLCIAFDGTNINGFILAYRVVPMIVPELFVAWTHVDSKYPEVADMFQERLELWARQLKVRKISAMVHKNLKSWEKKYGFELESYIISKELDKETKS